MGGTFFKQLEQFLPDALPEVVIGRLVNESTPGQNMPQVFTACSI